MGGRGKAGGVKLATDAAECREHAVATSSGSTSRATWSRSSGSSTPRTSPRSTTPASRSTAPPRSTSACCRPRAASRSRRWPSRTPTPSPRSGSTRSTGLTPEVAREWVLAAKLNPDATEGAIEILTKLYTAYVDGDADLCEINPLILTPDGRVHALDAKVTLDDNAEFRHEWGDYALTQVRDEREEAAHAKGLQYVGLDGYVGIIANGAGLAMSTLDVVNQVGGEAANFLDIGGGANADVMAGALEVINGDPKVALDLHQHLRRHHPRRRGRQRHRRGAQPGHHRRARSSSASTAPTPPRAGPSSSPTCPTSCSRSPPCSMPPEKPSSSQGRWRT